LLSVKAQIHSSNESFVLLQGNSSAQVVQEKPKMSDRWHIDGHGMKTQSLCHRLERPVLVSHLLCPEQGTISTQH
jgi:hypothetical protein